MTKPAPLVVLGKLKSTEYDWRQFNPVVTAQTRARPLVKLALIAAKHDVLTLVNALYELPSREQLTALYNDLDACQRVMHLAGGFDPAYVTDAQASLKVLQKMIHTLYGDEAPEDSPQSELDLGLDLEGGVR